MSKKKIQCECLGMSRNLQRCEKEATRQVKRFGKKLFLCDQCVTIVDKNVKPIVIKKKKK